MTKRSKHRAGIGPVKIPNSFTLVELLVAIAILSILALALMTMTSTMINAWQAGQANNERRATARTVLERISRDLRQASLPMNRLDTQNLELIINPSTLNSNYMYPQAMFWQAPISAIGSATNSSGNLISGASTNGNMAEIGYFVQWITNSSGLVRPTLTRLVIGESSTDYKIYNTPNNWIYDTLMSNAPATPASYYQGALADNVLGLWIQALDSQGNAIQQGPVAGESYDSRLPYVTTNTFTTNGTPNTVYTTNAACSLPAAMQIAIMITDSRTAQRLTGTERPTTNSLTGSNFWGDIQTFYNTLSPAVQKGTIIQSTTVEMAGGPR